MQNQGFDSIGFFKDNYTTNSYIEIPGFLQSSRVGKKCRVMPSQQVESKPCAKSIKKDLSLSRFRLREWKNRWKLSILETHHVVKFLSLTNSNDIWKALF